MTVESVIQPTETFSDLILTTTVSTISGPWFTYSTVHEWVNVPYLTRLVCKCKIILKAPLVSNSSIFVGAIYGSSLFFKSIIHFTLKVS